MASEHVRSDDSSESGVVSDAAHSTDENSVSISPDQVAHLARLARLAVTDAELRTFAGQLGDVLVSVARVGEVTAADIPPTSHAVEMTNVFRRDEVRPSLPREAVLAGAPAVEDEKFRVPRILSEES